MHASIIPKLPMHNKSITLDYYINILGFKNLGDFDYDGYLMIHKENIEIHFFKFKALDSKENYSQVYIRTTNIDALYNSLLERKVPIHPNGPLQLKPRGQKEFSLLDPYNNLLTFGQNILTER